jgi:hypothetical protein
MIFYYYSILVVGGVERQESFLKPAPLKSAKMVNVTTSNM